MPRQCAVCVHHERQAIDRAILAGEPKSVISRRWGLPPDATERHAKVGHVVRHEQIIAGKSVLTPREGDDLLEKLEELRGFTFLRFAVGDLAANRIILDAELVFDWSPACLTFCRAPRMATPPG